MDLQQRLQEYDRLCLMQEAQDFLFLPPLVESSGGGGIDWVSENQRLEAIF